MIDRGNDRWIGRKGLRMLHDKGYFLIDYCILCWELNDMVYWISTYRDLKPLFVEISVLMRSPEQKRNNLFKLRVRNPTSCHTRSRQAILSSGDFIFLWWMSLGCVTRTDSSQLKTVERALCSEERKNTYVHMHVELLIMNTSKLCMSMYT